MRKRNIPTISQNTFKKKQNRKGWGKAATEGARSNIMPAPEASYVTGIERI
jgi:hypothetical protein